MIILINVRTTISHVLVVSPVLIVLTDTDVLVTILLESRVVVATLCSFLISCFNHSVLCLIL